MPLSENDGPDRGQSEATEIIGVPGDLVSPKGEEPVSFLRRGWGRVTDQVAADDIRRYLPYAAVAAAAIAAVIGVWAVGGPKPAKTSAVGDTASTSELSHTFDDIAALVPGVPTGPGALAGTPADVPLPVAEAISDAEDPGQEIAPVAVTAPAETVGGNQATTETVTQTETGPPSTITETSTVTSVATPLPRFSLTASASASVQVSYQPGIELTQSPAGTPSTVTVVVTADPPSTATAVAPSETSRPQVKPTTQQPQPCRTAAATSSGKKSTTPAPTPTVAQPPSVTRTPQTTPSAKPTTTSTTRTSTTTTSTTTTSTTPPACR
ncbi:hypothetical protein [Nocardia sp. NPDC051570]|uniref:hypothetical protein n=1 Tax=Nocardia sp. NPDC051570 TaxID=3364324 RepID=UPI0037B1316F